MHKQQQYDNVEHPRHYMQYQHEVIELTEQLDFCLGNACKYILRAPFKRDQVEDLKKAKWYLNRARKASIQIDSQRYKTSLIELAKTFGNPAVDVLFTYAKPCESAFLETIAIVERMICDAEIAELKAKLAMVTAERDSLKALKKPPLPFLPEPQRYTPSFASGSSRDIEHGC